MIAKENPILYAEILYKKFNFRLPTKMSLTDKRLYSKMFSLITVNEVLSIPYLLKSETWFYNEVKKEIEKL